MKTNQNESKDQEKKNVYWAKSILIVWLIEYLMIGLGHADYLPENILTVNKPGATENNFLTICAALDEMEHKSLSTSQRGCVEIYTGPSNGEYYEHLNSSSPYFGKPIPLYCDIIGMEEDIKIIHSRGISSSEINIAGVVALGDNRIEYIQIINYDPEFGGHARNQNSLEIGDDCVITNCIIDSYHRAIGGISIGINMYKGKNTTISGCTIYGNYYPCVIVQNNSVINNDSYIYPRTNRRWVIEGPFGIQITGSGYIDNVHITSINGPTEEEKWIGSNPIPLQIGGIKASGTMNDLVIIHNTTIQLNLESVRSNDKSADTMLFRGINCSGGHVYLNNSSINMNSYESSGTDPSNVDDGAAVQLSALYVEAEGVIEVVGNCQISTSRSSDSLYALDGYERILDGTDGRFGIDFDTVSFDPNGDELPDGFDYGYVCQGVQINNRVANLSV